ncbi:hypothetical protein C9994_10460 [Marivirga lumbricoides]|uniref:Uncharacterized protein n=1 Tax=Marivirga lumbricoides TaxID=1046115 RepID=A0A2T4DPK2_9BACT|nr:hypothetical protein C9994_10460 [Marivirga lumbricoides]
MKRLLQIILTAFLLSSCYQETRLEGIWYGAYSIIDEKKESLSETTLFDFRDNQLFTITIRDLSLGDLNKVTIDSTEYELLNSKLKFKSYSPNIQISKDTITLEFENQKLVLRRIPENLRNLDISADCFHGSYFIQSKNYQDSIDFVNDSLLIYTGKYDQNFPGKKWQIVDYEGFKFLNIHEELQPVTIIKSCNSDGICLVYPTAKIIDMKLTPTTGDIQKEQLIGKWMEIQNSAPAPPSPPNLTEEVLRLSVLIKSDSIKINKCKRTKTYKWNLTSDGKRIYFIDRFLENDGSWKLLDLSDSSMTVRISSQSGFKEEIVKLGK